MTITRLLHALTVLLCTAPVTLLAQGPPPDACASPQHRQFDFWVGDWDVTTPAGHTAGRNRIDLILGGCALQENWTGAKGGVGNSYNAFDRATRKWHQTWVDNGGSVIQLDGEFADGKMVLSGETRDTAGAKVINRITWEPTGPAAVRQLWETSRDGGKTWAVAFDGRYKKRS